MMSRILSVLIVMLVLYGCAKKSIPSSGSPASYSEDLTILHPVLTVEETTDVPDTGNRSIATGPFVTEYDITEELDSLAVLIADKNLQKRSIDGFTVQVYSGPNRDMANNAKSQLQSIGLHIAPQVVYIQPNFRVKIGRFYSRLEANQVYARVREVFPNALLLPEKFPID